ncbi:hypothetical protein BGZ60DRAFT_530686 [Tricladium varicosporioides]|nr:hypothetical protein BGZ60DRAFT_530686 [Hymenoscyphus varicosporioides]
MKSTTFFTLSFLTPLILAATECPTITHTTTPKSCPPTTPSVCLQPGKQLSSLKIPEPILNCKLPLSIIVYHNSTQLIPSHLQPAVSSPPSPSLAAAPKLSPAPQPSRPALLLAMAHAKPSTRPISYAPLTQQTNQLPTLLRLQFQLRLRL